MNSVKNLKALKSKTIWNENSGYDSPVHERLQHKNQDALFKRAMLLAIAAGKERIVSIGVKKNKSNRFHPSAFAPVITDSRVGSPSYLCSEE